MENKSSTWLRTPHRGSDKPFSRASLLVVVAKINHPPQSEIAGYCAYYCLLKSDTFRNGDTFFFVLKSPERD
jgi:hypothetical protein